MAIGASHINGEGLCLVTVGLDVAATETARHVASQESVKVFTAISDYLPSAANAQLARQFDSVDALVCLIDFDTSKNLAAQTATSI